MSPAESQPLFHDPVGVMAVIAAVPVFFLWLERTTRWRVFNVLPAIIWVFLCPIFLSNFGVIPRSSEVYSVFKSFAVPMFIVLMLLDVDVRRALRVAWRGAGVLIVGALGIVIGATAAFALFRSGLAPDAWSGFGALAGSWIGGTGNLAAVAESLSTPPELVGIVVLVDNSAYVLYFPLILTAKRWAPRFDRFTRVSAREMGRVAESVAAVEKKTKEVHFLDLLTLLAWSLGALLLANALAARIPELPPVLTEKTWAILLVTSIGVALSATPLRRVPGSDSLSMTLVYLYMSMMGAAADLRNLGDAHWFLLAGVFCLVVHLALIILAARLFRVDVGMAAVASAAAVGGAASAPVVAGYHREELVPVSIMLALIGYALGNYLGVATAYLCHLLS